VPSALEPLLQRIRDDVAALPAGSVTAMRSVLAEAEREVAADLRRWLATHVKDGAERFTAQKYRSLLLQLREGARTFDQAPWLERLGDGTEKTLKGGGAAGVGMAAEHLQAELAFYLDKFGEPLEIAIERAWLMERGEKLLWKRFETSAARYAGQVGDDIRRQLAIGVARNESMHEMGRRLVRLGGPKGVVATRGILGKRGAQAEEIAEGLFTRYEHWADRLVRTEVINSYNVIAQEGLEEIGRESERLGLPEDMKLKKRWDAHYDKRLCIDCRELDGQTVGAKETFRPWDIAHPPLHPYCRCAVVAWAEGW